MADADDVEVGFTDDARQRIHKLADVRSAAARPRREEKKKDGRLCRNFVALFATRG